MILGPCLGSVAMHLVIPPSSACMVSSLVLALVTVQGLQFAFFGMGCEAGGLESQILQFKVHLDHEAYIPPAEVEDMRV